MNPVRRMLLLASLMLFAPAMNACAAPGNPKALIEQLIVLADEQSELLEGISSPSDIEKATPELKRMAKKAIKLSKRLDAVKRDGTFGKVMQENKELAARFNQAVSRSERAMQGLAARVGEKAMQDYIATMKEIADAAT